MEHRLPPAFVARMRMLLGSEADEFFATYQRSPYIGLRVNLLKLRPEHMLRLSPWALEPVPWCESGFWLAEEGRPGKHPYHAAGLYYLQEPSAMAVVEALQVRPGHRVLDLAAAPGGKSTQIAAALENEGLLVANEIEGSRIKALSENMERWGAQNVVITNETPERLANQLGAIFERVLLDAPCSGEGMFRKSVLAQAEWSPEHVAGCAVRQTHILDQAARLVAPGGLLVYSTCTFAPEENEQRIAAFLAEHPQWELVDLPKRHGMSAAYPEWTDPPLPELNRAVHLWPHRLIGEGHFIALLRNGQHTQPTVERAVRSLVASRNTRQKRSSRTDSITETQALNAWYDWEQATLYRALPRERVARVGDQIVLLPPNVPELGELRVVRTGVALGVSKPGRFEPAHALALALTAEDARSTVPLRDSEIQRYLHGETLPSAGPDAWVLMTVDGWPLGWGRRVGGVIKNFYPKGLRWM